MNPVSYIFRYINLRNERGVKLLWRNVGSIIVVSSAIALPFIFLRSANYFGDHGFLDRVGGFCATLTGFYIAGLAAVATFVAQSSDLDTAIEVGQVIDKGIDGKDVILTRREYVCSLFGYLAVLSLIISVVSSFFSVVLPPVKELIRPVFEAGHTMYWPTIIISCASKIFMTGAFVHLMTTTCHGLYYLVDRLYAKKPKLLPMDVVNSVAHGPLTAADAENIQR